MRIAAALVSGVTRAAYDELRGRAERPELSFGARAALAVAQRIDSYLQSADYDAMRALLDRSVYSPVAMARVVRSRTRVGGRPGLWLVPHRADRRCAVLYLHGGGYVFGSSRAMRDLLARLAFAAGVPLLSLDYRLAPEHPFPAALDDALGAVRWLYRRGYAPDQIALAGDSAGGGLAVATMLALRDAGEPLPAAAALLCPWVELTTSADSYRRNRTRDNLSAKELQRWAAAYAGSAAIDDPRLSPLRAQLHGLPPLLLQAGSAELFVDDIAAFAARAERAKVDVTLRVYPEMFHAWQVFSLLIAEGRHALGEAGRFFRRHLRVG